jgi:hypothetical protein
MEAAAIKELMEEIKSIKYEFWPIEKLVPYTNNPRKNDHVVPRMADLIVRFGMPGPLCVRPDGTIADGHLRYKAAKLLGLPELPVAVNETWTPEKVKAYRIAVNKSAEFAQWDFQLLGEEMHDLDESDFDLLATGFDSSEINKIMGSMNFSADDTEGGASGAGEFNGEDNGHVKMVQLFFDEETEKNFRSLIAFIDARFGSGNISDTVYSAVQYCAEKLEKEGVEAVHEH